MRVEPSAGRDLPAHRSEAPPRPEEGGAPPGVLRRLGSLAGLGTISILDLLALDDITTAGAWMPEILFVIASVPALVVLAYYAFRSPTGDIPRLPPGLDEGDGPER